jgi:hypothetical protein
VLHEAVGTITHAEGPFWNTVRSFVRGPGAMTRAYVAGRRKAFVPPARYLLVAVGLYYLVRFLLDWDPVRSSFDPGTVDMDHPPPFMAVNLWTSKHVNLLLPLLVVVLATLDRMLFPRTALNWTERGVHYIYAVGSYVFAGTLLIVLYRLWPPLNFLGMLVAVGMLVAACISLHRRTAWNVVKALLMVPAAYVVYIILCMVIAAWTLGVPLAEVFLRPG